MLFIFISSPLEIVSGEEKNCARLINTIFENPDIYISTKIPSIYVKSELLKVAVEAKSL